MKNNNFEEKIERQVAHVLKLKVPGEAETFEDNLQKRAAQEAENRLCHEKYLSIIDSPQSGGSHFDLLVREKRGTEEEYFGKVVKHTGLDGIDYYKYLKLKNGQETDPVLRGKFAKASHEYEEHLRGSVTSEEMSDYLRRKLFSAIEGDYRSLVWQLL